MDKGSVEKQYKISDKFVAEWLAKAKGSYFFGFPIDELSKDELISIAMFMAHREQTTKNEFLDYRLNAISNLVSKYSRYSEPKIISSE